MVTGAAMSPLEAHEDAAAPVAPIASGIQRVQTLATPTQTGRGGMGSHKHGVSGHSGKSPKMRMWEKLELRREQELKPTPRKPEMFSSVADAFDKGKIGINPRIPRKKKKSTADK